MPRPLPGPAAAGLYVYAILAGVPAPLPPLGGLEGGRVFCVRYRRLAAAATWVQRAPQPTPEDCLRHEEVVETLMALAPLLPVRFGSVFAGEADLRASLRQGYAALCSDLDWLAGAVEFTVRALWEPQEAARAALAADHGSAAGEPRGNPSFAGPGVRYLVKRQQHYLQERRLEAAARLVAQRVDEHLRPLAIDCQMVTRQTPRLAASVSYLVRAPDVPEFQHAFAALSSRALTPPAVWLVLSGPWPPYSFVSRPPGSLSTAPLPGPAGAVPQPQGNEMKGERAS